MFGVACGVGGLFVVCIVYVYWCVLGGVVDVDSEFCVVFFFFYGYGDHRELHRVDRRQRQMCIRDRY